MAQHLEIDKGGTLGCPKCHEPYLHIDRVEFRNPNEAISVTASGEDGKAALAVNTYDGRGSGVPDFEGLRRHQIVLLGWCDCCSAVSALSFTQHKGSTFTSLALREWRMT